MQVDVVILTSVIGTVVGIVVGTYGMKKSADNTIRLRTEEQIAVSTKLDYVIQSINDIKIDLKTQDKHIQEINSRLIKVEESSKIAHHRLDGLEYKIEEEEKLHERMV